MFEILQNKDLTRYLVMRAPIGWIALTSLDGLVLRIQIGLPSKPHALANANSKTVKLDKPNRLERDWASLLEQYFGGEPVDFSSVAIDEHWMSPFSRRVVRCCRNVSYGQVISYGQLARGAGSPGAARAVGTVMAKNRYPLVVPCHRVVASGGRLGGFSAPRGVQLKRRLLQLEGVNTKNGALIT